MKKRAKWILGSIVGLIFLICLAGFVYYRYYLLPDLFKAGPIKEVDLAGWEKLEEGMTKKQVVDLLGDSQSKQGTGTRTIDGSEDELPELWIYNWTRGISLFGLVHPKSYVVYFDGEGRVASWREPIEGGEGDSELSPAVSVHSSPLLIHGDSADSFFRVGSVGLTGVAVDVFDW